MTRGDNQQSRKTHLSPRLTPHRLSDADYQRVGVPVFFTLCTADRREFLLTLGVPELIVESLEWNAAPRGTCVICYCIMPNHVHLIACNTRDGEDIRDYEAAVKKRCWFLFREAGVEPPYWQRSYWDEHAESSLSFDEQVEYVLANPRRKGLCHKDEDWPYLDYRGFYIPNEDGKPPVQSGA